MGHLLSNIAVQSQKPYTTPLTFFIKSEAQLHHIIFHKFHSKCNVYISSASSSSTDRELKSAVQESFHISMNESFFQVMFVFHGNLKSTKALFKIQKEVKEENTIDMNAVSHLILHNWVKTYLQAAPFWFV